MLTRRLLTIALRRAAERDMKLVWTGLSHAPHTMRTRTKKKRANKPTMATKRLRSAWRDVTLPEEDDMAAMRPIWHRSPTATTIAEPPPSVTAVPMKAMLRASSVL